MHRPAEQTGTNAGVVGSAQLEAISHGPFAWQAASALATQARVPPVYSPHLVQQPVAPARKVPMRSQSASFEHEASTGG